MALPRRCAAKPLWRLEYSRETARLPALAVPYHSFFLSSQTPAAGELCMLLPKLDTNPQKDTLLLYT
jgi:hypothetical protein